MYIEYTDVMFKKKKEKREATKQYSIEVATKTKKTKS